MLKTTIITATYNRANVLKNCILSVVKQHGVSCNSYEHLILDDGSTDETEALISELKLSFPQIRYVRTPNQGLSKSLNLGLELALGEYIAFLDSDDEYESNHLELMHKKISETPDSDFVLGSFNLVTELDPYTTPILDFYNPGQNIRLDQVECITGVIFGKRESFLLAGGFRGKLPDIDFYSRTQPPDFNWTRLATPTYRYFFGRCENNLSQSYIEKILA